MFWDKKETPEEPTHMLKDFIRQQNEAPLIGSGPGAQQPLPPRPALRPGQTPPRDYIASSLVALEKTHTSYVEEGVKLEADIAKLREEQRQLILATEAVTAAIHLLRKDNPANPVNPITGVRDTSAEELAMGEVLSDDIILQAIADAGDE